MRVIHRVSISDVEERRRLLTSLEIEFNASDNSLVRMLWFDIEETHPAWNEVRQLIARWQAGDIIQTRFTSKELEEARHLQVSPAWHHGYPQPEENFGFLNTTYELNFYCHTCGTGKTQVAPFRMKNEPKWGKRHFLQLNWVFDEFFVLPDVWNEVFEPLGVGCLPVLEQRTERILQSVVQLDIKNVSKSALSIEECPSTICGTCGRKRYLPISGRFFPPFLADPLSQVCRSQEYFGSGASAWKAIVVANELFKMIQTRKLMGLTFIPMSQSTFAESS